MGFLSSAEVLKGSVGTVVDRFLIASSIALTPESTQISISRANSKLTFSSFETSVTMSDHSSHDIQTPVQTQVVNHMPLRLHAFEEALLRLPENCLLEAAGQLMSRMCFMSGPISHLISEGSSVADTVDRMRRFWQMLVASSHANRGIIRETKRALNHIDTKCEDTIRSLAQQALWYFLQGHDEIQIRAEVAEGIVGLALEILRIEESEARFVILFEHFAKPHGLFVPIRVFNISDLCEEDPPEDESKCAICFNPFQNDRVELRACHHAQFCYECIDNWLIRSNAEQRFPTCPLCRRFLIAY